MARLSFHNLKWNFVFEVQFTSVIRGHHFYKSAWTPTLGEKLPRGWSQRSQTTWWICNRDVFGSYYQQGFVGHVPMKLSYLIYTFLRAYDDNEVSVKVTGSRRLENRLVVIKFSDNKTRHCRPLKKYRNNQYPYSSCALHYFFFFWGSGHWFEVGRLKSTFWGWALIRGWVLINFFLLQGGRLFQVGCLSE